MRWNLQTLGLRGRTQRTSMITWLEAHVPDGRGPALRGAGIICAWSLNELPGADREHALERLLAAHARQASVLIVEPVASSAAPWWGGWRERVLAAGGRADEWRLPPDLPAVLAELDEAAGFRREYLTARSFWLDGSTAARPTAATHSPSSARRPRG
jgi:hypothetical protein